jgi:DinB family protein
MESTAADLRRTIQEALPRLLALDDQESARPLAPGKWCPRELLGHLIDSAANNHQRFVRARFQDDLVFPGYDQDAWVRVQDYAAAPWRELVELWRLYNLHLARVLAGIPDELARRAHTRHNFDRIAWRAVPAGEATTLEYFAGDYVEHLRHHLRQMDAAT